MTESELANEPSPGSVVEVRGGELLADGSLLFIVVRVGVSWAGFGFEVFARLLCDIPCLGDDLVVGSFACGIWLWWDGCFGIGEHSTEHGGEEVQEFFGF